MQGKLIKKLLSLLLIGTMAFGMIACGASEKPVSGEQTTVGETSAVETTVEMAAQEITYPLADAPKLTIWTNNQPPVASVYADYTQSPYHAGLAENTGVEMEWIYPTKGANVNEAYNLMLTDEELPHLISNATSLSDAALLAQDGLIYDLTDYLPIYAPDYWAFLNSDESLMRNAKADDGRIYGVKAYVEGDYNGTYIGPVIRQDWLDECGLDMPVTLADWEEVLVAFKEKYDAKFAFTMKRYEMGIASGTNAQASILSYRDYWYVDENGKVQLGQMDESWKESLEVLHRWYEMGLLDQDSFTMDDNALRAKVLNDQVGVSITALSQMTNWINDAKAEGTGSQWVGMEYPRVAEGVATSRIQAQDKTLNHVTMITTTCTEEELITALKWLNYGFTEEGHMYINFGTQGETYTLDADGNPQWTALITEDPDGIAVAVTKYTGAHSTPVGTVQDSRMVRLKNDETSAASVDKWINNTDNWKYMLPALALTQDETVTYGDLYTPIKAYCAEMALKFILGEESLDNFDAFVEELKAMGVEKCQAIQQAAYDRYLAR